MSNTSFELQQTLYTTLNNASIADGRVYDHVPQNVVFPYVQIGDVDSIPDDLSESDGQVETVTIHIWSRYRGQKEVKQISDAIQSALHRVNLPVVGRSSAIAFFRTFRCFLDADGLTRHGVVTVEVIQRN